MGEFMFAVLRLAEPDIQIHHLVMTLYTQRKKGLIQLKMNVITTENYDDNDFAHLVFQTHIENAYYSLASIIN